MVHLYRKIRFFSEFEWSETYLILWNRMPSSSFMTERTSYSETGASASAFTFATTSFAESIMLLD